MNIYIDIDGVIMANDKQPALHLKEFLQYITDNYSVYWLTTHCKGDSNFTVHHLSQWLDAETLTILSKIKATNWDYSKTEAIDFKTPFLWFDDYLFDFEKEDLIKHNSLKSWVEIDFSKNVNQLKDIINDFPKNSVV
jgi:hypothetical protein